ncbi:glycosyltransferase family 1 protein [Capnocytophaga stomatis]|uniref:Glycosyltransferase family 1 protein n=1 Tax=Capnocytophaga stomatis TaxID=1848904 RepID=A0A250FVL4_9FLAO|nr:glycosyltransferase family 4 protein [Capnocytophaga stomatis]ATA89104.1 glycosyltransferase family 1 protein [Capnocytophaga stomatis]
MIKLFRTSTIAASLDTLLKGQLRFLNQYFEVTAISGYDERLEKVQQREGVKTHPIEMQRSISPIRDFVSLVKLYLYFKKEKPEIVHSITPKAGLLTMLAGKLAGVPIRIHTFTGLIFPSKTGMMQKLLISMDRLLCWSATHVYPEGNGVKNDLINYKITSKPLKVIANGNVNGIDLVFFSKDQVSQEDKEKLRQKLNIAHNDFIFIFVGRLVGDKGINELVKAFKNLKVSNLKLLLVGPMEEKLDPLKPESIIEIEKNKDIIYVGFQKDVRPFFAISDALVFPSYREGFPNVVIQAGAMELPSIVSNINGCNEIIIEGENGIIIPAKDTEELEKKMKLLFTDKDFYNKLKQNSRRMITERYEQSVVWKAILEEYKKLTVLHNME